MGGKEEGIEGSKGQREERGRGEEGVQGRKGATKERSGIQRRVMGVNLTEAMWEKREGRKRISRKIKQTGLNQESDTPTTISAIIIISLLQQYRHSAEAVAVAVAWCYLVSRHLSPSCS